MSEGMNQMTQEGWRVMYVSEGLKGFVFASSHTHVCYEHALPQAAGAGSGDAQSGEPARSDSAPAQGRRSPKPLSADATQQIVTQLEGEVAAHKMQLTACRSAPADPASVDAWVTVLGSGVVVGAQVEGMRPELAVCVERTLKTFRISPFPGERSNKKIQVLLQ